MPLFNQVKGLPFGRGMHFCVRRRLSVQNVVSFCSCQCRGAPASEGLRLHSVWLYQSSFLLNTKTSCRARCWRLGIVFSTILTVAALGGTTLGGVAAYENAGIAEVIIRNVFRKQWSLNRRSLTRWLFFCLLSCFFGCLFLRLAWRELECRARVVEIVNEECFELTFTIHMRIISDDSH